MIMLTCGYNREEMDILLISHSIHNLIGKKNIAISSLIPIRLYNWGILFTDK